ncbi:glycoside hydrolase family 28 protein [Macrolepiota fuliginosa MF-IS2]|uniref:galacturonan 1,4-alpha-galacturonidase n=1 Tax=Macrolepiota fuliginosa MF-IS2 TaxID=1400762 RepID=A0A9P5XIM5_9AGAR|nr:glycoside hydrolase family 28 protein [Macrolepiota fuliginosa MF-IS2]
MALSKLVALALGILLVATPQCTAAEEKTCTLHPLGPGVDDTDQVEAAIAACGHNGTTVFGEGSYNITRKMMWNLQNATVDLHGFLSFNPDIQFWLNPANTFRVVFIQSQASWFVVTGSDFVIDAHNTGGIQGNGQPWWTFFTSHTREDGDGRPISLTLWQAVRGVIRNFRIESPPFWSNTAAESQDILYDGMFVNASNTNPSFAGQNIVPNTDGINTYRSDKITLLNWDITCGDDCLAIKGNSSNIIARNVTCRGGNGIAFGSLGQYANMSDLVENVLLEDLLMTRIDSSVQPNMQNGVYFKTWDGSINGVPPTGGGGASGMVRNVTTRNVRLDRVNLPLHIYQTNGGHSADAPSTLNFSDLNFIDWSGTALTSTLVDIECSPAAGCRNITFQDYDVAIPVNQDARLICQNVDGLTGLDVPCNATGRPA